VRLGCRKVVRSKGLKSGRCRASQRGSKRLGADKVMTVCFRNAPFLESISVLIDSGAVSESPNGVNITYVALKPCSFSIHSYNCSHVIWADTERIVLLRRS
jgi:hypothetical protein